MGVLEEAPQNETLHSPLHTTYIIIHTSLTVGLSSPADNDMSDRSRFSLSVVGENKSRYHART